MMTRTRDENASDLSDEAAMARKMHAFIDQNGLRDRISHIAIKEDLDEDRIREAFRDSVFPRDGIEGTFDVDDFAREAVRLGEAKVAENQARIHATFGEADVITGSGNCWYIIQDMEQAQLASSLGQTALSSFWGGTIGRREDGDSHVWMIMVDDFARANVSMAALRDGQENGYDGALADCHVTGFMNRPAFQEHEPDIRDACSVMGLVCTPNHMGEPLATPDQGPDL